MSYKSRPEGWINPVCIGYCKLKADCPGQCIKKSKFVDCRPTCVNLNTKCDECNNAEHYKED